METADGTRLRRFKQTFSDNMSKCAARAQRADAHARRRARRTGGQPRAPRAAALPPQAPRPPLAGRSEPRPSAAGRPALRLHTRKHTSLPLAARPSPRSSPARPATTGPPSPSSRTSPSSTWRCGAAGRAGVNGGAVAGLWLLAAARGAAGRARRRPTAPLLSPAQRPAGSSAAPPPRLTRHCHLIFVSRLRLFCQF